jgi:dUTPase
MPTSPPIVIKGTGYTSSTLPTVSNNVVTLVVPTTAGTPISAAVISPFDLLVQIVVPEGYVAFINSAPTFSTSYPALTVVPSIVTAQGPSELKVFILNDAQSPVTITTNTPVATIIFAKLTPSNVILTQS